MMMSLIWTHPMTGGRLYVSGIDYDAADLAAARIEVVVSHREIETRAVEPLVARGGRHHFLPFEDVEQLPDAAVERQAVSVIREALDSGRTVLVHCEGGWNRSPYIASRVLIEWGLRPADAVRLVERRRGGITLCNRTFRAALLAGARSAT